MFQVKWLHSKYSSELGALFSFFCLLKPTKPHYHSKHQQKRKTTTKVKGTLTGTIAIVCSDSSKRTPNRHFKYMRAVAVIRQRISRSKENRQKSIDSFTYWKRLKSHTAQFSIIWFLCDRKCDESTA